jgi:hypothetical protein
LLEEPETKPIQTTYTKTAPLQIALLAGANKPVAVTTRIHLDQTKQASQEKKKKGQASHYQRRRSTADTFQILILTFATATNICIDSCFARARTLEFAATITPSYSSTMPQFSYLINENIIENCFHSYWSLPQSQKST